MSASTPIDPNFGAINASGYRFVCRNRKNVFVHVLIAEQALGRKLPPGACVHHINGDRLDNRNENLLICPSIKYHNELHTRAKALEACGNAHWRRCNFCGQHDDPSLMYLHRGGSVYHRSCRLEDERTRKRPTRTGTCAVCRSEFTYVASSSYRRTCCGGACKSLLLRKPDAPYSAYSARRRV